jgi:hypothetical protein
VGSNQAQPPRVSAVRTASGSTREAARVIIGVFVAGADGR